MLKKTGGGVQSILTMSKYEQFFFYKMASFCEGLKKPVDRGQKNGQLEIGHTIKNITPGLFETENIK